MSFDRDDYRPSSTDDPPSDSQPRQADGTYRRQFEPDESPTVAVARAVARLEGVTPGDLSPLNDWLDPDALDSLTGPQARERADVVTVEFWYEGYRIAVDSDGEISIEPGP